jgi:hypothetical protein
MISLFLFIMEEYFDKLAKKYIKKLQVQYGFGFGGSMKRMVRILRSTVMVRVGGGWEALDGFLAKHDPCRAKVKVNLIFLT